MRRMFLLGVAALALAFAATPLAAQGPQARPTGTWVKKVDQADVTFKFAADTMEVLIEAGGAKLTVHTDYGMSKDGIIFGRVNKVEKEGLDAGPNKGDLFQFRIQVKGDNLTVTELGGDAGNDDARKLIEGTYKRADKKK